MFVGWIQENIEQKPVDVFTALDVHEGKKAEYQEHTFLYTAFARAMGIPTRVVNGIAYASSGVSDVLDSESFHAILHIAMH